MVGAIGAAVGGWWLQITALTDYSSVVRILLSSGFCVSIYLFIVIGLFRLIEPIKVAVKLVQWTFCLTQDRQRQAGSSM